MVGSPGLHEVLRSYGAVTLGLEDAGLTFDCVQRWTVSHPNPNTCPNANFVQRCPVSHPTV